MILFKNLLIKLAYKILSLYGVIQEPVIIYKEKDFGLDPVLARVTLGMVEQVESKFGEQSGEFKRHQVLRAMINTFPAASERDIAFAIELAVRGD